MSCVLYQVAFDEDMTITGIGDYYLLTSYQHLLCVIFTMRCYASAVLAMALCPSVRSSVSLLQVGVLLKRSNVGSYKQQHTIAQGL